MNPFDIIDKLFISGFLDAVGGLGLRGLLVIAAILVVAVGLWYFGYL